MALRILVRGGGDLASGVILRLHRAGWQVLVTELPSPLTVRRFVSFAQAIYDDDFLIEGVRARKASSAEDVEDYLKAGEVPVIVDPDLSMLEVFRPQVLIDARMRKAAPEVGREAAALVIGLGPGFTAGHDCHAVIETNRGAYLGRVYWEGTAQADTGIPERRGDYQSERVLRAPADGVLVPAAKIGDVLAQGAVIAQVAGEPVTARFDGVLRGLIYAGLHVKAGDKIGDLDPRIDPSLSWLVSDKSLSVAGGVLEAILAWQPIRAKLRES
jgi:xanthine dehydrogenase accessory factor